MKPGAEYEKFIFERLSSFFKGCTLNLNDKIIGNESGILREIDISIRTPVYNINILYIVQCKDWKTKVDIKVIGELSAVMQDVGAVKGYLVCSAGFAKSNYKYALTKGIELITVTDMQSEKWKTEVAIPVIYIRNTLYYTLEIEAVGTEETALLNKDRELVLSIGPDTLVRIDGVNANNLGDLLGEFRDDKLQSQQIYIQNSGIKIQMWNIWIPCNHIKLNFVLKNTRYLKYISPIEYTELKDHIRGITMPIKCKINGTYPHFDDGYVEIEDDVRIEAGLSIEIEESQMRYQTPTH